jgi:hypothetical protein
MSGKTRLSKENILDYLSRHKQEFQEKYHVEAIGLFGSYARDEATEESDIDIFVRMAPDLLEMSGLKLQIEEELHKQVDLIREHKHIKPLLLKMIQKDIAYV